MMDDCALDVGTTGRWEHFPHDADIGIRGLGLSKAEAFEQGAVALTAVITDPQFVSPVESITLYCEGENEELLFVEWLNELIYEMATRKMLFSRFEVQVTSKTLQAKVWGESLDQERHQPAVEVKGATYTDLHVQQKKNGVWVAQCVVDV
jgi:tRNA nucleotidyltransferase (CCA-adding enzyme)